MKLLTISLALLLSLTLVSCEKNKNIPLSPNYNKKFEIGNFRELGAAIVSDMGGTIIVNKPGEPLNHMKLIVPFNGQFEKKKTYRILYAPLTLINEKEIEPYIIKIVDGGGYSREIISIQIPITSKDDEFIMPFYYDEKTGSYEGMPIINANSGSITIGTRHEGDIILSRVKKSKLLATFESGFNTAEDQWQIPNYGTYAAPLGHCSGECISAMWYYIEKRLKNGAPKLYGLYDNYSHSFPMSLKGLKLTSMRMPITKFWEDDNRACRLASAIQTDQNMTTYFLPTLSDDYTFYSFAEAIRRTHQPQWIGLVDHENSSVHVMIVYKSDASGLYLADPNEPQIIRKIDFSSSDKSFAPFQSSLYADGSSYIFPVIYMGKSALINTPAIDDYWNQFESGTVGNSIFPKYSATVQWDENGSQKYQNIIDGSEISINTESATLHINAALDNGNPIYVSTVDGFTKDFERNGSEAVSSQNPNITVIGKNDHPIGLLFTADAGYAGLPLKWVDFIWINVKI